MNARIWGGSVDLHQLARHDPEAAQLGYHMHLPQAGGTALDGAYGRLQAQEFRAASASGCLRERPDGCA